MVMRIRNLLPAVQRPERSDVDHPFYSLQHQMNSLFDDFFSGFDMVPRSLKTGGFAAFIPSVDVKESDKEFTIRAELPGVEEKDIEVTVTNDTVTIKGEKKEEKEARFDIEDDAEFEKMLDEMEKDESVIDDDDIELD